jgi:predicted MPP superfamily phosphohydrolase
MKIRLLSDLHIEGYNFAYEHQGEDLLILAGDITTARHHIRYEELITSVPEHVRIFYVTGNHEYYHGTFDNENVYYKSLEKKYPNYTFLNNEAVTYGGVEFFGGTMFTDFALDGVTQAWFAKNAAKDMIADFYHIQTSKDWVKTGELRRWNVQDHIDQHQIFLKELESWIITTEGKQRIVISHFMPAPCCTAERYKGSATNPYFTCDMTRYFGLMTHWFAGHGHNSIDTVINDTRLIMNPRGYGSENHKQYDPNMIIEV